MGSRPGSDRNRKATSKKFLKENNLRVNLRSPNGGKIQYPVENVAESAFGERLTVIRSFVSCTPGPCR